MKTSICCGKISLVLGMFMLLGLGLPGHSPADGPRQGESRLTAPMLHLPLADVQTAVSGGSFACALTNGGAVHCWGANGNGELGDGTNTDRSLPVPVVGLDSGVNAIAVGSNHACAVTSAGAVKCWGFNLYGQLGDGTTTNATSPVTVAGLTGVAKSVTAGLFHTCALKTDGSIQCWGDNYWGQLGGGPNVSLSGPAASMESGDIHTCAVLTGGGVQCWGSNQYGQLGDGTTTDSNTPVTVTGLAGDAASLSAGSRYSCAVLQSGSLQCWGRNNKGQLGDGTTIDRLNPVGVTNLATGVLSVSGGESHSCAVLQSGGLQCWGRNKFGQLGNGTTVDSLVPVAVTGLDQGVKSISAGSTHTVAVGLDGKVTAWGANTHGELGNGAVIWANLPLDVAGLPVDNKIAAPGSNHTCSLLTLEGVLCWGDNTWGQLGDGTDVGSSLPVPVPGLGSAVAGISAGGHNCVVIAEGGVQCWGYNEFGQLGDGTTTLSRQPVSVQGLLNAGIVAVAVGGSHTCALNSTGEVFCWGANSRGQLGNGTFFKSTVPVKVVGLSGPADAITAGDFHTCARLTSGFAQCWGGNLVGELGNGDNTDSAVPAQVIGLRVISLDAGGNHTCGVTSANAVKCWGSNLYGGLGNGNFGTGFNSNIPVDVVGLSSGIQTVVAGQYHTCARSKFGGALKCWGSNTYGQLGDGTNIQRNTPIDVSGLDAGVSSLDLGAYHTCAVLSGGRLKCWGWNGSGQLGLGSPDLFKVVAPINVLATVDPQLTWNYPNGKPGSFFTLTGQHFPPGSFATVTVNGAVLTANLVINPTGGFILFFDTAGADSGFYQVRVTVNPGLKLGTATASGYSLGSQFATSSFILDPSAPLNIQEGGGQVLAVPEGIGGFKVYLPLLLK